MLHRMYLFSCDSDSEFYPVTLSPDHMTRRSQELSRTQVSCISCGCFFHWTRGLKHKICVLPFPLFFVVPEKAVLIDHGLPSSWAPLRSQDSVQAVTVTLSGLALHLKSISYPGTGQCCCVPVSSTGCQSLPPQSWQWFCLCLTPSTLSSCTWAPEQVSVKDDQKSKLKHRCSNLFNYGPGRKGEEVARWGPEQTGSPCPQSALPHRNVSPELPDIPIFSNKARNTDVCKKPLAL
jgi:hypothetical protein